jgi:hypothetical protein
MKWTILILVIVLLGNSTETKIYPNHKNKISVGLDKHLRYERIFPNGFHLGTDLKYSLVLSGDRLVHLNQRPESWLLTAGHLWHNKYLILENRVSFGNYDGYISTKLDSGIRKQFRIENKWAFAPFVRIVEYVFSPGAYDDTSPPWRAVHHGVLKTELGVELELLY